MEADMKLVDVKKVLKRAISSPNGFAYYIWGGPGIGKSSIVRQVCDEAGIGFIDFRLAQCDPTDIRGIPFSNNGAMIWLPPVSLPAETKDPPEGILFLDELNLAPPSVQAAAYQLILDRQVGEYKLPEGWLIVAAGNREGHRANVYPLPAPLINRFIHIDVDVDFNCWVEWATKNNISSEIIKFLSFRKELFYKPPTDSETAFPTPRSWEMLSRQLTSWQDNLEIVEELACGIVGPGTAYEFTRFLKYKDDAERIGKEILRGRFSQQKIKDLSLQIAVMSFLVEKYREDRKVAGRIIDYACSLSKEMGLMLFLQCIDIDKYALTRAANFSKIRDKFGEVVS
jgi:hypothetical protein